MDRRIESNRSNFSTKTNPDRAIHDGRPKWFICWFHGLWNDGISTLIEGLVNKKVVKDPSSITCSDVYQPSVENAATKGYSATNSNKDVCANAKDVVVIAVKPNMVEDVCINDISTVNSDTLIISIAAGISLETLQKYLQGRRIVRVMPNTPCLIGEAASGYDMGQLCNDQDREIVQNFLEQ